MRHQMVWENILGATQQSFCMVSPSTLWELSCQYTAAQHSRANNEHRQPSVNQGIPADTVERPWWPTTSFLLRGCWCASYISLIISPQVQCHSSKMLCCDLVMGCWINPAQCSSLPLVSSLPPTASMRKAMALSSYLSSLCIVSILWVVSEWQWSSKAHVVLYYVLWWQCAHEHL